jgi:PPM family protein phosphatase
VTSLGSGAWSRAGVDRRALLAAGRTDAGVQREVNEDRFHVDTARGLFVVIDGVGGQAAGGRAADVALSMARERLERETGPVADRIREAIAVANNEIFRLASTRAEWQGMACVLTIAVVNNGTVTVGHVGDTRLYRIRHARLEKVTRDHSPVGEREDAGELSESQAMRHPRRNEVYRDVGSELHAPADADFIEVNEIPFEPDAALLLCTDGLTDLVDSTSIARIISERVGDPDAVVAALIDAANDAGGKDNVTVVYVEGEQFASAQRALAPSARRAPVGIVERARASAEPERTAGVIRSAKVPRRRRAFVALAILALVAAGGFGWLALTGSGLPASLRLPWSRTPPVAAAPELRAAHVLVVQPDGSIADALRNAPPESEILVEPGEYREQLVLQDRVRLVSRVPRGATIRLPATASDRDAAPAVVASGLSRAELVGFRIVGDSATPLAVGIRVEDAALAIVDVDITGATRAALEFSGRAQAALVGSDVHDNPGPGMIVYDGAAPRIAHNVFARNGTSERAPGALVVMKEGAPRFTGNVFLGLSADTFRTLDNTARLTLENENWFVPVSERRTNRGPVRNRPARNK